MITLVWRRVSYNNYAGSFNAKVTVLWCCPCLDCNFLMPRCISKLFGTNDQHNMANTRIVLIAGQDHRGHFSFVVSHFLYMVVVSFLVCNFVMSWKILFSFAFLIIVIAHLRIVPLVLQRIYRGVFFSVKLCFVSQNSLKTNETLGCAVNLQEVMRNKSTV